MVLLHPSSIGKIMTEPKDKSEILSVGAKTYLKSIAREMIYGFSQEVDVKFMRKGNACEQDSIDLLNRVMFKRYEKNSQRIETDLFSGECDILRPDYIRDIKTSWSLATFPCIQEDAQDKDYEWQGRTYMLIYDRPKFYLDYCMVTTPDELRRYEQAELHEVDHIDPRLRVTTICYERDADMEKKIIIKATAAQLYIESIKAKILLEHE